MADQYDVEIGRRIRAARIARGMSQTDLGNKLGISFQQVQKYEKGSNRVGSGRLWVISRVLQVPVMYFFDDLDAMAPTKEPEPEYEESELPANTIKVAKLLNEIPDEDVRTHVFRLIKAFARAS